MLSNTSKTILGLTLLTLLTTGSIYCVISNTTSRASQSGDYFEDIIENLKNQKTPNQEKPKIEQDFGSNEEKSAESADQSEDESN